MRSNALRRSQWLFWTSLLGGCLGLTSLSCGSGDNPGAPTRSSLAAPDEALNAVNDRGARLGVYRAFWPKRTDVELRDRVSRVVGLIRKNAPTLAKPETLRDIRSTPFTDPDLVVSFKEQYDDLWVRDMNLLPSLKPAQDIGEEAARAVAAKSLKAIHAAGLAAEGQYSDADFGTGHHKRAQYAGDGSPVQSFVVEYRFRALRKLNGIDVANNAIVLGVTPSGQLSSVRIGGAQIDSAIGTLGEKPTAAGRVFTRAVDTPSVERRFAAEVAKGKNMNVLSKSVMYFVPRLAESSLIAPVMVYRYAETFDSGAAEPTHRIGYSLEDAQALGRDVEAD